ncbi:MAG: hypothetical protein IJ637_00570 [Prevotella sp.]|nr:hypothetical protein [Prevotella sp.]
MAELPIAFTEYTRRLMGDERFERYLKAFDEEPPVSIRLNPQKTEGLSIAEAERVPWCRHGYYLKRRPNFTMDPLLHAGCYYVQEAASMFLDEVLRQLLDGTSVNGNCLDLCAAPGGKSTLLRAALPADCMLYSNEPIRKRADVLAENVAKWGYADHVVTNLYPRDYRKSKMHFDIILCDVPCSGEGMFRKAPLTIGEWSPQQVETCAALQREIVADVWPCLNDGGLLIYSTCTFNTKENEENIRWILSEYDARVLPVSISADWHITGSLLPGFSEPVYRFIPGITRGEGLFMAVLQKGGDALAAGGKKNDSKHAGKALSVLPSLAVAPSPVTAALSYQQAISYLRGESLTLPADTPRGEVTVCFEGFPLGLVKNIGTRANNLYPKPWRIKTTHIPADYEPVFSFNNP